VLISTQMLVFCLTATVLILTPGPNFIYILTRGSTQGRRTAMLAAIGLGGGVLIHTTLASLGVAALVRSSYLAFQLVKYAGSLYLVYLGVKTLRHSGVISVDRSMQARQPQWIVWQSMIASLTNPKTILFFLSFLPQFVNRASANITAQLFLLGGIYMVLVLQL
jgi:threonine/homoserine/homoserine lactone efflux protein